MKEKKISNKKKMEEERRIIFDRIMNEKDPEMVDALSRVYGENSKSNTVNIDWIEIVKIGAILATGIMSVATQVYVAKQSLLFEETGTIRTKTYPYKGDVKVIKF